MKKRSVLLKEGKNTATKYQVTELKILKLRFFRILYNSFKSGKLVGWESGLFQVFKDLFFSEFKPSFKMERKIEQYTRTQVGRVNGILKSGDWPMIAPYGYNRIDKKLVPNKDAEFVQQIFQLRAYQRMGTVEISNKMRQAGFKNSSHQLIKYILANPVYTGKVHYLGKIYHGTHDPIVSRHTFDYVQSITKTSRVTERPGKPEFSLSNFLRINGIANAKIRSQFKAGVKGSLGASLYTYYSPNREIVMCIKKEDMDKIFSDFLVSHLRAHPICFESEEFLEHYNAIYDDVLNLIASEISVTEAQIFKMRSLPKNASKKLCFQPARLANLSACQDIAIGFKDLLELGTYGQSVIDSLSSWKFMSDSCQREIQLIVFPHGVNIDCGSRNFSPR